MIIANIIIYDNRQHHRNFHHKNHCNRHHRNHRNRNSQIIVMVIAKIIVESSIVTINVLRVESSLESKHRFVVLYLDQELVPEFARRPTRRHRRRIPRL